jgi:hypothetical protein
VIAGLFYATGASARHQAALATAKCEPSPYFIGLHCITQPMVRSKYEGIVTPAVAQLATYAAAYTAAERHNLAAAEAALTAEVSTEQALASSLAAMAFTPQHKATADAAITYASSFGNPFPMTAVMFTPQLTVMDNALIQDIQTVARLTGQQARSSSLGQLRSLNRRVDAAISAVQAEMTLIRTAVAVLPTAGQEPCAPCF